MSARSSSGKVGLFLALVLCCAAIWGARPALAIRILMVGGSVDPTNAGDVGTFAVLSDAFGEAAVLGDDGVFYLQGSASSAADAELVDVVFISSTLTSGDARNKFQDATVGVLNHEEALMHANLAGNFFMVAASAKPNDSQLNIVDADHPLAAGLPEGIVDVFTAPQVMSVGSAPFPEFDLAPDAFVIAEVASDSTLKGIYAIEEGGELLGDGTPGRPAIAAGRRVMFFLENQGGNFLTPDGEALVIAAVEWLAGVSDPSCPRSLAIEWNGTDIELEWALGNVVPTGVRVERNGTELAASAPADPPRFVDASAAPGALSYELTFDGVGEDCRALSRQFDTCISDLSATVTSGDVELGWTNNFAYTEIQVRRGDALGDELIATLGGDQTSYTDPDPPPGQWTYFVVPENGDCDPTATDVRILAPGYPSLVSEDGADGYWRLDEDIGSFSALNAGAAGAALDGTYSGTVGLQNDSLLATTDNPSAAFDGFSLVNIPDHTTINIGGPFTKRTIELWFQADTIAPEPRILYEEGGATRGINIYVQDTFDEGPVLVMTAWNLAEEQWGPRAVQVEIEEGVTYHAVMVFFADDLPGNFDGRITGYLDGEEFDTILGADRLYAHSDDIAIGGLAGGALFADGTSASFGTSFVGAIDEVAVYNLALDDPNGDGNLDDNRVEAHFLAGSEGLGEICDNTVDDDGDGLIDCGDPDCAGQAGCGRSFRRGDTDGNGKLEVTDPISNLTFQFVGTFALPCKDAADFDDSGQIDISDPIANLAHQFLGDPPPPAPGIDTCGPDPTADDANRNGTPGDPDDDLGCETYPAAGGDACD